MAAIEHTVLQFSTSPSSSLSAKVHPLVIFNICDCYVRRPDQSERVIGTLLGSVLPDGTVDIRNSYAVPHMSAEQVALDIEYHHNMLISHQKVNPKEVIVGWYSTGLGVTGGSALFHEFYSREAPNPVHLTVDTGFVNGAGTIKAYVSVNLSLGDRQLAAQFQEIPLDLRMVEAERVGYDILKTPMVDKLPTDLEGMEASMERLLALIDDVYKYVDNVVEGRAEQDNTIGRFLFDTIASLPKLSPSAFDKRINDSLQDNLLLLYLSSITRTQLTLAEKLNTAAQETRNNFGIPNFLREAKFLDDAIADLGHSLSADCIWVQSTCSAFRDSFPTRKELVGQLGTRTDLDPILREIFQFDRNTRWYIICYYEIGV